MATYLIKKSINLILDNGYGKMNLVVTRRIHIYKKLGFTTTSV